MAPWLVSYANAVIRYALFAAIWKVPPHVLWPVWELVCISVISRSKLRSTAQSKEPTAYLAFRTWQGFPATKLGTEGEIRQGKNLLDAARKAGVQHFIQSTGGGVTVAPELAVNQGKLAVEQYARKIGIPLTVMRPVFFMENFDNPAWGMPQSLQNGQLDLPFHPDTRLMVCAVEDLAAFVVIAFDQPDKFIGCSFDVASDEMTMRDIASTFTRVMGRPVAFTGDPASLDALAEMDADLAGIFRFEIFERGFRAFLPGLRALHPGLSQLEEYLRQKGWANR
ncbi:NmrA family protein [Leptospira borgpetersenii serovar Hardjo-bovis str. Sponselee]|uniref:NmrA family protein n=1 Tax=Leptospira borgpetersenii serovar Hardjo-bovis str. Sponselee TaxID=1303729 RepID=M6BE72_LEPBO|nr:Conserved hypothetical protein [Leptospira borgpetersenii serovar Hardjo-bovis str. L550]AMX57569.1 hypothetical protein LBK6_04060 [Leptospira borgpetersenii serovar Hardjo]EMJ77824.1 NmrA family protein [Leptospira borgpetersenii serovar Hardjo-bovis str. Sponselee]AMX60800.1 hypothetical protein LBK9_04005 [Leptospira borgpetersenii serovar Hardjo]AMX64045.1 hypothetical protein LBK30_04050 [Leptospira borgpetersenii serovar Hardjo]